MHETSQLFDSILAERGFTEFVDVTGRRSVADEFAKSKRCGIYVLRFENGDHYAGQAVDVARRFSQHRVTFSDIVGIAFLCTAKKGLTAVEKDLIETLDAHRLPLRNIVFASAPTGESDLDLLVPRVDQDAFLTAAYRFDCTTPRAPFEKLRRQYESKFTFLDEAKEMDAIEVLLGDYVKLCLLAPRTTESSFWASSCLPQAGVYTRISVNWQEVVTIYRQRGLRASFHVAKSPLQEVFGDDLRGISEGFPGITVEDHRYQPGGIDQVNVECNSLPLATRFFRYDPVVMAARLLNLRLMRKGPCNFARYHCPQLADLLLD